MTREDGRRARWAGHREARRAELVETTVAAIRTHGPQVGMDEIAAMAGTSKPILYRYFTDRADLYVAVGRRAAGELLAALDQVLDADVEPRAHVAAVIDTYLSFIEADPNLYRFVVGRGFADRPVDADPVADYSGMVATHLTRVLGDRLRAAGLDSGGAEGWAHGIVGMVQAAGDWWLDRRSMSRGALTEYLTTLLWNGFDGILSPAQSAGGVVLQVVRPEGGPAARSARRSRRSDQAPGRT